MKRVDVLFCEGGGGMLYFIYFDVKDQEFINRSSVALVEVISITGEFISLIDNMIILLLEG